MGVFCDAPGHKFQLFGAGFSLMIRLPICIGHAVNQCAALLLAERTGVRNPVAKAVAAKPCQPHQVYILGIGSMLEVPDQPAECSRSHLVFKRVDISHVMSLG